MNWSVRAYWSLVEGRRPRGFTMLEMLVAMGATTLMVLYLNQVFGTMSRAVGLGVATSAIIENARVIGPQIERDAERMLGPKDNGLLVIINRRIPGNVMLTKESSVPLTPAPRADQVMWIRGTDDDEVLVPAGAGNLSGRTDALFMKVTYGHALRTEPDGTAPRPPYPPGFLVEDLGMPGGASEFASRWVFGRQALYLDPQRNSGPRTAYGAWYDAVVTGYGSAANHPPFANDAANYPVSYAPTPATDTPFPSNHAGPLYLATADVAACGLARPHRHRPSGFETSDAIIGTGTNNNGMAQLNPTLSSVAYRDAAYPYTYAIERLRVNPEPLYPAPLAGAGQHPYESWQFAQMHPYLADNVIEFQVQFAGDYQDESTLGNYAAYFAGRGMAPVNMTPDIYPDGSLIWYGIEIDYNFDGVSGPGDFNGTPNINETPAQAPVPLTPVGFAAAGGTQQPIYHDINFPGGTGVPPPHADAAYIFRHGADPATNWPYLIRFRYRLIDPSGRLADADGGSGKLFEQIIRVRRG